MNLLIDESLEMDQDLKKTLKEMAEAISIVAKSSTSPLPHETPSQIGSNAKSSRGANIATITIGVIAVLGFVWGIVAYTVSSEITKAFVAPNQNITKLQSDVNYLRRDVDKLRTDVDTLQTQHNTAVIQPGSKASPREIAEAATQLQEKKIELPRAGITQTAQSLIRDASLNRNPAAWDAATKTLGYLSFLNSIVAPSINETHTPTGITTHYGYPLGWQGTPQAFGDSTTPNVPQFHALDQPDENAKLANGPSYLVLTGGVLKLDNWMLKRMIIVNATIVYAGGPVRMEGVYFVNCTFSFVQQKNTELFAQALLTPDAKTDFSTPSSGI